jgi:aerobic-type carbon monoxide dehydrogenase small subunit (CoxS/CutS family)
MMTHELLAEHAGEEVGAEQINAHLEGNLCRCGSYPQISRAIETVAVRRAARCRHSS